ncbi:MAG: hypothetical protein ACJ8DC_20710 [Gemmatimonadales bacterium]
MPSQLPNPQMQPTNAGWPRRLASAPEERAARILAEVGRAFGDRFGRVPEVWSTRAAAGVRREAIPAAVG